MRFGSSLPRPMKEARFTLEHRGNGLYSCLPVDMDTSYLMDITGIGDVWIKFLDTRTGAIHDSADYHAQLLKDYEE